VPGQKGLLDGVKFTILGKSFHGHDFPAVGLDRELRARLDCLAVK
jgi:hypothetical protein